MFSKHAKPLNECSETKVPSPKRSPPFITISERVYALNPSKSKFVCVGFAYEWNFQPRITIRGCKNDIVNLKETDWHDFVKYEGVLINYFHCVETFEPIILDGLTITFAKFQDIPTIKLEDRWSNVVYLGMESVLKMFELKPLISYTLNTLKSQEFASYFDKVVGDVRATALDVRDFVLRHVAEIPRSENVRSMLELAYQHPELSEFNKSTTFSFYGAPTQCN